MVQYAHPVKFFLRTDSWVTKYKLPIYLAGFVFFYSCDCRTLSAGEGPRECVFMHCGVYIITNISHRTLYVGMSTDLPSRIQSHRDRNVDGFAKKYRCFKLVYYEGCVDPDHAYKREKQIKGWTRIKKTGLITATNPTWRDLFDDLITACA